MSIGYKVTEWGLEQSRVYHNKDRSEEEFNESLFHTFSPLNATQSMASLAALLIGDQNAGKTTLLHALADDASTPTFLHLQSLIPSILSIFNNCRFCNVDAVKAAGLSPAEVCSDEGNFLDSDIARASVTLCKSDWVFLLEELGVKEMPLEFKDVDFVRLSFIEFGGDHLDRLQGSTKVERSLFGNERVDEICKNSRRLLESRNLTSVAYFINANTAGPVKVSSEYIEVLSERLAHLKRWCPHLTTVNFYVTRIVSVKVASPDVAADCPFLDVLSSVVGCDTVDKFETRLRQEASSPLFNHIQKTVEKLCSKILPFVEYTVRPLPLIREDGVRDPCSIYFFVASTLQSVLRFPRLGEKSSDPELLLQLIACIKNTRYYAVANTQWVETLVWTDKASIARGYQEDEDSMSVPLSVLLPHAMRLLKSLAAYGGCLGGSTTAPKIKIVCEDAEMKEAVSSLRALERCPQGVQLTAVVDVQTMPRLQLKMNAPEQHGMEPTYRFPMNGSLCESVFRIYENAALIRHDNIDWESISEKLSTLNQERVLETIDLCEEVLSSLTRIGELVEQAMNAVLDLYTLGCRNYHKELFLDRALRLTLDIEGAELQAALLDGPPVN